MVKRKQYEELAEQNALRYQELQMRSARLHGQPFVIDPITMLANRLEALLDHVLGENTPENQARTKFEFTYHEHLRDTLDSMEEAITKPPQGGKPGGSGLIVPRRN